MERYKQRQTNQLAEPAHVRAHQPVPVRVQQYRAFAPPYSLWSFQSKRRTAGKDKGKVDVIILPPGGPKLFSKVAIMKWRDGNDGVLQVPLTNDAIDKMWRAAKLAVDSPGVTQVLVGN